MVKEIAPNKVIQIQALEFGLRLHDIGPQHTPHANDKTSGTWINASGPIIDLE